MSRFSGLLAAAVCLLAMQAAALDISYRYRSPRNPERKIRTATTLIILHTTEAPARSSLNKVSDRGECHFCVTEEGTVYAIVDRDREAFHAGRSMWCGKEDVDKYSVGIECVGYHDKPMPLVQLRAIAALVKDLQKMYALPDQAVIAHSHVAYGAPNKWQKKKHRGRKRCGMLFATKTVRKILDLKNKPLIDQDVRSGRLTIGDPELEQILYHNVDFMARYYPTPNPTSAAKPKALVAAKPAETKPKAASGVIRTRPAVVDKKTQAIRLIAKPNVVVKRLPDLSIQAKAEPKTISELRSQGYQVKGIISPATTAVKIAGARWNAADTYYTIRDKVYSGKTVNPAKFEKGMSVWMKK